MFLITPDQTYVRLHFVKICVLCTVFLFHIMYVCIIEYSWELYSVTGKRKLLLSSFESLNVREGFYSDCNG
jgi:hypothetical protein